ncbi:ferredoxin [Caballeronia hypogeia]|uniref:Ferredoxin n=1 Tax=Caballeronia hypogeia TaxID=1777140 RepID=A0A158CWJ4_9BURK|nr:PDR/VanB family oxidoreductase [Caballeronia hypogeia]SAK86713.1 ferredoxin [Caballeronia hypogeia]
MSETASNEMSFRTLVVTKKEQVAEGIVSFELRDADGRALAPFTAGAHVTVRVPSGANRNYSLCNDPSETDRYVIAVKRDAAGRGGSISMTDDVAQGDRIEVSEPRNEFGLNARARRFVFVAGGIGITPILSMMRHLRSTGEASFKLYYLTRNAEMTAFIEELSGDEWKTDVVIHHDHGKAENAFDFWPVFEKPGSGAHVYCCGPRALMDGVRDMTGHWPQGSVHFESFGVDQSRAADNKPFSVKLERSGRCFEIPKDRSILEILRDNGIRAPSSCESGTCGSCRTTLCAGEADHRDMVLGDDEKSAHIMICVSRAKSEELVLDL